MNAPIVTSATTGFVLPQPTMSPQIAHSVSPAPTATGQMTLTPPHPSPSPHVAANSPAPMVASSQQNQNMQFTQTVSSVGGQVACQQPTVIQTMATQNGLQFTSQVPMLSQGQLSAGGYIQSLYSGQQQMLLSPAGGLTIHHQQALNPQGPITVQMQNAPQQKMHTTVDGKPTAIQASVAQNVPKAMGGQMITTLGNMAAKMQIMNSTSTKGHPTQQFVTTQQGANGQQTLVISSLGMAAPQGQMQMQTQGIPQQPNSMTMNQKANQAAAAAHQQKFLGTQKPIQLTGLQTTPQYRHINATQQLITTAGGQSVLSQPQILGPLQAFNAFGTTGLSWAGQGNPILQSPILIRNQHDGSVYIQSAPTAPQQAPLQSAPLQMQQQIQNTNTVGHHQLGSQMSAVPSMHSVLPGMVHSVGPGTLVGSPVQAQTPSNAAPLQQAGLAATSAVHQATHTTASTVCGQIPIQADNQVLSSAQPALQQSQAGTARAPGRQMAPQQFGMKVAVVQRQLRGIQPRIAVPNSPSMAPPAPATDESSRVELKNHSADPHTAINIDEDAPSDGACGERVSREFSQPPGPPMAAVAQRSTTSLPVDVGSTSPAVASPFPEEGNDVPESHEEASEILTHIVEGFVIREGPVPFPVTRTALLEEILLREQNYLGNKERKRKHDAAANKGTNNNNNKSNVGNNSSIAKVDDAENTANVTNNNRSSHAGTAPAKVIGDALPTPSEKVGQLETRQDTSDTPRTDEKTADRPLLAQGRSPLKWNVQDVYEFVKNVPGCEMYADKFRSDEIDGEALQFLRVDHLVSRMNVKLGPAAKISARFHQLNSEWNEAKGE